MKIKMLVISLVTVFLSAGVFADESICDQYKKSVDEYLAMSAKDGLMKDDMETIKTTMEDAKKSIDQIPEGEMKQQACKSALEGMEESKKNMEDLKKELKSDESNEEEN